MFSERATTQHEEFFTGQLVTGTKAQEKGGRYFPRSRYRQSVCAYIPITNLYGQEVKNTDSQSLTQKVLDLNPSRGGHYLTQLLRF